MMNRFAMAGVMFLSLSSWSFADPDSPFDFSVFADSGLKPQTVEALKAWAASYVAEMKKTRRADVQILDISSSRRYIEEEPATFVIEERIKTGRICEQGVRQVVLNLGKRVTVKSSDPIGYDCCSDPCSARTPIGWMLYFSKLRGSEGNDAKLKKLVDPAHGLKLAFFDGRTHHSETIAQASVRGDTFGAMITYDPIRHSIECPQDFDADGKALCRISMGSEEGMFIWRKQGSTVYLEEASERDEDQEKWDRRKARGQWEHDRPGKN